MLDSLAFSQDKTQCLKRNFWSTRNEFVSKLYSVQEMLEVRSTMEDIRVTLS